MTSGGSCEDPACRLLDLRVGGDLTLRFFELAASGAAFSLFSRLGEGSGDLLSQSEKNNKDGFNYLPPPTRLPPFLHPGQAPSFLHPRQAGAQ